MSKDKEVPTSDIDDIMAYEGGDMSDEDTVKFFQKLIDNGMAWKLQGHYGRMAKSLIESGQCHRKGEQPNQLPRDKSHGLPSPDGRASGLADGSPLLRRTVKDDLILCEAFTSACSAWPQAHSKECPLRVPSRPHLRQRCDVKAGST